MSEAMNGNNGANGRDGRDAKQDPSALSVDLVMREVLHLRELIEARLEKSDKRAEQVVEEQQLAVQAALASSTKAVIELDTTISRRLDAQAALTVSKFEGVSKEFVTFRTLLDANAAQAALALASADKAVAAAFASSKEAINKAENSVEKRFDLITKQIDELKSYRDSTTGTSTGKQQYWGYLVAGAGLIATVLGMVIVLANVLTAH